MLVFVHLILIKSEIFFNSLEDKDKAKETNSRECFEEVGTQDNTKKKQ